MADAAVQSLLDNLTQLLIHHVKLISNAKSDVEQLEENVKFFKSFLKQVSSKRQRKDETLRRLVGEIRSVVYDADDVIDSFVTQAAEKKTRAWFSTKAVSTVTGLAWKVNEICCNINKIYGGKDKLDFINLAVDDAKSDDLQQSMPSIKDNIVGRTDEADRIIKDNIVGRTDEADRIVSDLREKTEYLDVISIIGMPGLGKTTLTAKIFHDPNIKYEFPTRIWVYVSQEFVIKQVFLSILRQIMSKLNEDDYAKRSAAQLAIEIAENLERGKFLLVMDDVWEPTDWDQLKVVLPKDNRSGKVMITSRQEGVGRHANRYRKPHKMRPLNIEESYELLQRQVFNKAVFPPEFAGVGKEIASKCGGLPLAIVVIGGVLTTKVSRSVNAWKKISRSVPTFINEEDGNNRMDDVISMTYFKLPYHLKECFLYLGIFPEDFEIPTWKLIRMWIAEGLIQQKDGFTMEETAEIYLNNLINWNLVRVDRLKADGRVKTCRIHDMLRDFCNRQGGKDGENFLLEIKQGDQPFVSEGIECRRICTHSNVLGFLSGSGKCPNIRSFITFAEDIEMPLEDISVVPMAFKQLRVLEAKPLIFTKIPRDFYHMVHLRYLMLSLKLDSNNSELVIIPKAFSKLWKMQTLIVDTTSRILDIKADIMSMTEFRHLKTNASTTLVKPSIDSKEGEKLQMLGTMSPESCTEEVLSRARNLKVLGIRGKIAMFFNGKVGSFDSMRNLGMLEKLKLLNDVYPEPALYGRLDGLPPAYTFPPNLRSLTLFSTFLDWPHMSVLALLENLQVLKLKNNAFMGTAWEVRDGFQSLKVLHIQRTELSIWKASANHFPNLKRLKLHNCENLREVPIGLADIPGFEYLDLQRCRQAAASAMKIASSKRDHTFNLSIIPSDDMKINV